MSRHLPRGILGRPADAPTQAELASPPPPPEECRDALLLHFTGRPTYRAEARRRNLL